MDIKSIYHIENISLVLNEQEVEMLIDLIEFAFDYESVKPNSLYETEKIFGRGLLGNLEGIIDKHKEK